MKRKHLYAGVACLAAVVLGTSACGGSSSGSSSQSASFSFAEIEPDHLIPGASTLGYNEIEALWAPLTSFQSDGSLKYVQAQSVTGSPDAKTWTIKLKPGWTFHNGEPVTAQSYVDGWNTTAYGPNAYINGGTLSNIVGYTALNPKAGTPTTKTMSGLKALNATTIQVQLISPDSQFPVKLSAGGLQYYPLPKAALTNLKAFDEAPIGDGPYEMDGKWEHNQQIKMKAFPGYKGTKPKTDHLVFKLYTSMDTAFTDVQAGNVDFSLVRQNNFNKIKSSFPDKQIVVTKAPGYDFLGFPLFEKKFQDIRLREAISLAIDRNAINKALFAGLYSPADSLLTPANTGGSTHSCGDLCTFNPARAKQLLAQAGGWNGTMVIAYPGGVGYDQTFQAIANQIHQNLGIAVSIQASSNFTQFVTNLTGHKYTKGPVRGHWGSATPSPGESMVPLYTPTGNGNNATYYSNATVTSLLQQATAASSLDESTKLYDQAERLIMKDFPVVPLFFNVTPFVMSSRVTHVDTVPGTGQIDVTSVTVK